MNTITNDYKKSFIELLYKSEECYYPNDSNKGVRIISIPDKELIFYMAYPDSQSRKKYTIYTFCSTIHVNSALVLLLARNNLKNTSCNIEITFTTTSTQALYNFLSVTDSGDPAMITVTDGTAKKLEEFNKNGNTRFYKFIEVQPAYLHWTSPNLSEDITLKRFDIQKVTFVYLDHPTDVSVFNKFCHVLIDTGAITEPLNISSRIIKEVPEKLDIYRNANKYDFFLTNRFWDSWALQGRSPSIIKEMNKEVWNEIEKRYIYINNNLYNLVDAKKRSISMWLQTYLTNYFRDLRLVKKELANNFSNGGLSEIFNHGLSYLGIKN